MISNKIRLRYIFWGPNDTDGFGSLELTIANQEKYGSINVTVYGF